MPATRASEPPRRGPADPGVGRPRRGPGAVGGRGRGRGAGGRRGRAGAAGDPRLRYKCFVAYAVREIFRTLQGEGGQTGTPMVFVRFAGCNLWSGREAD